jgi:hypothetical protein
MRALLNEAGRLKVGPEWIRCHPVNLVFLLRMYEKTSGYPGTLSQACIECARLATDPKQPTPKPGSQPLNTVFPRIHRNGTSAEQLMEPNRQITQALHQAIELLQANGPNGRDYCVNPNPIAYETAAEAHRRRVLTLKTVLGELDGIADNIQEQIDAPGALSSPR